MSMKLVKSSAGFTLVELLVAMAVFSGMLLIVSSGFIGILRMHNQAVAANNVQDSARTAMDTVVHTVRNSTNIVSIGAGATVYDKTICVDYTTAQKIIYLGTDGVLYRATNCATRSNPEPLTSSGVTVVYFMPAFTSQGPDIVKSSVQIAMTVTPKASFNTTNTATHGKDTKCGNSITQRTFCSVVTLTSGATPR